MSTSLHLKCDGCDAEIHTAPIRTEFVSFSGRGYGFGVRHMPDIDKAVEPTKWVWSDPYTGCTYCPECWKQIENGEAA
jgi:hypothetical protein